MNRKLTDEEFYDYLKQVEALNRASNKPVVAVPYDRLEINDETNEIIILKIGPNGEILRGRRKRNNG